MPDVNGAAHQDHAQDTQDKHNPNERLTITQDVPSPLPSNPRPTSIRESVQDDPNPRSPKRRRTSPPETNDDFNIEAAAERALASALGAELPRSDSSPAKQPAQQDGDAHANSNRQPSIAQQPLTQQARLDSIVHLDEAADQILSFLARLNAAEIGEMLFGPPSTRGHEYRNLKAKFDQVKTMYITNSPFLSAQTLDIHEPAQIETIRKVNLATFMASIFSGELGMRVMDINFIDVFVPDGGRLLKAQASIYLELKTQAFVAAARTAPQMLNQIMLDLFPPNMASLILLKRPGAKTLAPTEQDFLNRLNSRKDILWSLMRNNKLHNVHETYSWNNFAREVSTYLTKYVENLASGNKNRSDATSPEVPSVPIPQRQMELQFSLQQAQADPTRSSSSTSVVPTAIVNDFAGLDDMVAQAARAAEIAMASDPEFGLISMQHGPTSQVAPALNPPGSRHGTDGQNTERSASQGQTEFQHYTPSDSSAIMNGNPQKDIPHVSQTAPTQVLYERARQVNKGSPSSKKVSLPSHRRPWSTDEENALMTGLDEVRGPHWSQILAMYGPGGTVNESLKDRNQVQLKDKARNLKLFFLKAGIEVPYYLQAVTGDLKSRAPGQAEKLERDKIAGDTEQSLQDDNLEEAEFHDQIHEEPEDNVNSDPGPSGVESHDIDATTGVRLGDVELETMIAQAASQANAGVGDYAWT